MLNKKPGLRRVRVQVVTDLAGDRAASVTNQPEASTGALKRSCWASGIVSPNLVR